MLTWTIHLLRQNYRQCDCPSPHRIFTQLRSGKSAWRYFANCNTEQREYYQRSWRCSRTHPCWYPKFPVPVRLMNLSTEPRKLWKGTDTTILAPVDSVAVSGDKLQNGVLRTTQPGEGNGPASMFWIPEHLHGLFDSSCEEFTNDELGELASMLRWFSDTFSRGDGDISRTTERLTRCSHSGLLNRREAPGAPQSSWSRKRLEPLEFA